MKKLAKWIGVFAVVVCLGLAMTACTKTEGKYSYTDTVSRGGYELTVKATIELKKDGKCTMTEEYKGEIPDELKEWLGGETSMSTDGTYTIDGDKITITLVDEDGEEGAKITGTIKKGKSITVGEGDSAVTYKK